LGASNENFSATSRVALMSLAIVLMCLSAWVINSGPSNWF